ncbi:MAG: arsenite methyltransferase [Candidatus Krumholzibacteriia bacterium]
MTNRTDTTDRDPDRLRAIVQDHYGAVAASGDGCCAGGSCGDGALTLQEAARRLGYAEDDVAALPADAALSLGCGNPLVLASLKPGQTVLDLGSGAGFDALLAAARVGPTGKVIGVDMTPAMVERASSAAAGRDEVEFRLGRLEELPVADASVDVIISNCVINLSPEKERVFAEAFRVLKPGGRLAIADPVKIRSLEGTRWEGAAHLAACISGAMTVGEYEERLHAAGFTDVRVAVEEASAAHIRDWDPGSGVEQYVRNAYVEARRPAGAA